MVFLLQDLNSSQELFSINPRMAAVCNHSLNSSPESGNSSLTLEWNTSLQHVKTAFARCRMGKEYLGGVVKFSTVLILNTNP